jgi:hypothetical protein
MRFALLKQTVGFRLSQVDLATLNQEGLERKKTRRELGFFAEVFCVFTMQFAQVI